MIPSFRCQVVFFGLLLVGISTSSFADSSRRTLLATGDKVPGFGAIGGGGFDIKAVTDDGRLVVAASLSDGRQGLFFAAHRQLSPIWTSDQAPGVTIDFYTATASSTGAVAVAARVPSSALPFFYVFTPAGEARVVHPTSPDATGNTLCYIDTYHSKVNGSGDIAFLAEIAPPGRTCESFTDSGPRPTAIYVTQANQLTRAVSSLDPTPGTPPDSIELVRLADDGAVIALRHWSDSSGVGNPLDIVRVKTGGVERIAGAGDGGPSGASLALLSAVVANAAGDVAFTALEVGRLGLYRTEGGLLIRVAWPLVSPTNAPYGNLDKLAGLNDVGDIAFAADWYTSKADGSQDGGKGVVLYRAGDENRSVFVAGRDTGLGRYAAATGSLALSEQGVVAFGVTASDGDVASLALTWSDKTLATALASGDPGPNGTVIAAGGLDWYANMHCLAPDGRIAAVASSTTGHEGLVCVDADGPHLVVQSGTIAPDGFAFTDFASCSFTNDGGLIFAGSRGVPDARGSLVSQVSVYRAGTNGVEHLFGDFDPVSNGTSIEDWGSNVDFVANARGSVLALAYAGGQGLFLRHDGRLDVVSYGNPAQWGLADNDAVVTIERVGEWRPPDYPTTDKPAGNLVLVRSGDRVQIVAFVESAPPTTFRGFTDLAVRGDLVLFTRLGGESQPDRVFFYRLGDAEPHEISPTIASGDILDFTPAGRILRHISGALELLSPEGTSEVIVSDSSGATPFGVNDLGDVALYSYANPPDSPRQTIELVGPGSDSSVRCPHAVTPPVDTPRADTPTPTPTATSIVGVGQYRAYVSEGTTDRVAVIETATQELLATVMVGHAPTALAASPDGRRLFVLAGSTVDIVDTASLQVIRSVSLGEGGAGIIAAPDSRTALVTTWGNTTGLARLVVVDADTNLTTSMLLPVGRVFGLNPSNGRLLATLTTGAPCDSQGALLEIDPATATIVRRIDIGRSISSAVVSDDGTRVYVPDGCSSQLFVVDLATFAVVDSLAVDQNPWDVVVTRDGAYAYTTHGYSSYFTNPDGSYTTPRGYLSAVDLGAGTVEPIAIAGGETEHLAVTPDSRFVYVTMSAAALGSVAVIDTQTNTQVTSILPGVGATDVVVAPVPGPAVGSPTPQPPRIVLRPDSVAGLVGDDLPVAVRIDSQGFDIGSMEHELITTWNSPVVAAQSNAPDCRLTAGIAAVASFEFDHFCSAMCDRVHVSIRASAAGASLPHDGILYTCTAHLSYYQPTLHPIVLSGASATDIVGQALPVFAADGEIRVLSPDVATPRPTRTRPPTSTATTSPTPTPTMLPVAVEIGSATLQAGSLGAIPVVLHTNGAAVVGVQNEIAFPTAAPITATASGKPQCAVNPAIAKPSTSFAFVPPGCSYTQGECTGVRALVVSIDDVNPIADGSVLYTCVIEASASAPAGTFPLHASGVYASDPSGRLLPASAVDGKVAVSAAPVSSPSVTVTPTPTISPVPVATVTARPTSTPTAAKTAGHTTLGAGEAQTAGGSGCNVAPHSDRSGGALVVCGLLGPVVYWRRRQRRSPR
jgi:YVTN family beta-propeller protein